MNVESMIFGKQTLADSVEDPLEASPLCSKVALADLVEDALEASPLCSKVALADSIGRSSQKGIRWVGPGEHAVSLLRWRYSGKCGMCLTPPTSWAIIG